MLVELYHFDSQRRAGLQWSYCWNRADLVRSCLGDFWLTSKRKETQCDNILTCIELQNMKPNSALVLLTWVPLNFVLLWCDLSVKYLSELNIFSQAFLNCSDRNGLRLSVASHTPLHSFFFFFFSHTFSCLVPPDHHLFFSPLQWSEKKEVLGAQTDLFY